MPLSITNVIRFDAVLRNDSLAENRSTLKRDYSMVLANGTGANQADLMYSQTHTIADGATLDLDLTTIENAFGTALAAAEVVEVFIASADANTTNITVGGSAQDFTGLPDQTVTPGGQIYMRNPSASGLGTVTDGSSDTIRLVNASGASASVDVYVSARSA